MYVVRRSFKCFGKCFTPGDVINDVTGVKSFKSKLVDRKIVEVTEQNYGFMKVYFKQKFGVDLPVIKNTTEKVYVPEPTKEAPKTKVPNIVKVAQPTKVAQPAKIQAAKVSK